ncbi:radical SAM protein [Candidatus Bathyarchaeota archaeon]|nr:radical SAM protein [Candidatus Bathyarchaeota archaeon]
MSRTRTVYLYGSVFLIRADLELRIPKFSERKSSSLQINDDIYEILRRSLAGYQISRSECLRLMEIENGSPDMYHLFFVANRLTHEKFNGSGEVHAQVGIDFASCPRKCLFCVFGSASSEHLELSKEEVVSRAKLFEEGGADAIYLMTTAGFDFDRYLDIGGAVREAVSPRMPLVANIDDFGPSEAQELVDEGFTATYHVVRLREGRDTEIKPETRIATIKNASRAGLKIFFCVEPVGPEHTSEEIVDLMFLGRELGVAFSGAMRRTSVPGTPLQRYGEIRWIELAKIVAVTRLVMGDSVAAHCTHEPNLPSLMAGANLVWAETGPNPRDICPDTSRRGGRGLTVQECKSLLWEAGFKTGRSQDLQHRHQE